jgi:ankyrin repeat protein
LLVLLTSPSVMMCRESKTELTPLLIAARNGHLPIVTVLLSRGADARAVDSQSRSAVMLAQENGHRTIEVRLQEYLGLPAPTEPPPAGGPTLHYAAAVGDFRMLEQLLQNPANVPRIDECQPPGMSTPLHVAAAKGHAHLVHLLIKYRADPHALDGEKQTPFLLACRRNKPEVMKALLEHEYRPAGGEVKQGLLFAARNGHTSVLETLFMCVARTRDYVEDGIMMASENGQKAALAILEKNDTNGDLAAKLVD